MVRRLLGLSESVAADSAERKLVQTEITEKCGAEVSVDVAPPLPGDPGTPTQHCESGRPHCHQTRCTGQYSTDGLSLSLSSSLSASQALPSYSPLQLTRGGNLAECSNRMGRSVSRWTAMSEAAEPAIEAESDTLSVGRWSQHTHSRTHALTHARTHTRTHT